MKLIRVYGFLILVFCVSTLWSQSDLNIVAKEEKGIKKIEVVGDVIKGPARIKFNSSLGKVSMIEAHSGNMVEKNGVFTLIWYSFPEAENHEVTFTTENEAEEIGSLSYLIEGEKYTETILFEPENPSRIPDRFLELDLDRNDEISVRELNEALNGFFDATNSLSSGDLLDLIDYFFEQ